MSGLVVAVALAARGTVSPTWTSFSEARAANNLTAAPILDFSYAGYDHGERGIPAATGVRFDVTTYGAVADDGMDDLPAVTLAIRAAEAAGGGIVFFPKGRFHLSEVENRTWGCINITGANVVLKGSGSGGPSATELYFRHTTVPSAPHDYDAYGQKTAPLIKFYRTDWKSKANTETNVTHDAAKGAFLVRVGSTASFSAGTQIRLTQQRLINGTRVKGNVAANEYWLQGLTARPESTTILEDGVPAMERHQVKAVIDSTTLELAEPLMCSVTAAHGWVVALDGLTAGWGVEDLNLVGGWSPGNVGEGSKKLGTFGLPDVDGDGQAEFSHHHNWVADNGDPKPKPKPSPSPNQSPTPNPEFNPKPNRDQP